jgi:hypothetical protein
MYVVVVVVAAVVAAAAVIVVVAMVVEYRVRCENSLGRFYNVQDQIVVPECSMLILY